ncbi:hypothetical protein IE53DRAFT_368781 [Violaceomyces palustris]|uniref:Uncharacterized protein n=1 Tax=Violaceomyces palustris TaxID=1673888 RepID=A0ACD0NXM7_9BASI|nr:hypothetical protein IE53DRAFT_368781 [Violaceomyces palustris]
MTNQDEEISQNVARACISIYHALPPKGAKPMRRSNNLDEWTILSGIVLRFPDQDPTLPRGGGQSHQHTYLPIAIATGMKCLPYENLSLHGDTIHDSHSEVLTRRIARSWFLSRLVLETGLPPSSPPPPPSSRTGTGEKEGEVEEDPDVISKLSVSLPDRGHASNALLEQQRIYQDLMWERPLLAHSNSDTRDAGRPSRSDRGPSPPIVSRGRNDLRCSSSSSSSPSTSTSDRRISLRTKPGRPDSKPSISMSCSDKMSCWNLLGLQGSLLCSLVEPIRFHHLVLAESPLRSISLHGTRFGQGLLGLEDLKRRVVRDLEDVLHQRFSRLDLDDGVEEVMDRSRERPRILFSDVVFRDSKEAVEESTSEGIQPLHPFSRTREGSSGMGRAPITTTAPQPSPGSLLWSSRDEAKAENLVNGIRLGASSKRKGKQALSKASRSKYSKLCWMQEFKQGLHEVIRNEEGGGSLDGVRGEVGAIGTREEGRGMVSRRLGCEFDWDGETYFEVKNRDPKGEAGREGDDVGMVEAEREHDVVVGSRRHVVAYRKAKSLLRGGSSGAWGGGESRRTDGDGREEESVFVERFLKDWSKPTPPTSQVEKEGGGGEGEEERNDVRIDPGEGEGTLGRTSNPPLLGWLVTHPRYESFDVRGTIRNLI